VGQNGRSRQHPRPTTWSACRSSHFGGGGAGGLLALALSLAGLPADAAAFGRSPRRAGRAVCG